VVDRLERHGSQPTKTLSVFLLVPSAADAEYNPPLLLAYRQSDNWPHAASERNPLYRAGMKQVQQVRMKSSDSPYPLLRVILSMERILKISIASSNRAFKKGTDNN